MKIVIGLLVIVLVLLQISLWTGEGSLSDIQRLEAAIEEQAAANARLAQRNEGLLQEVSDLKNGLDSVEEHARSELGLIKRGETYYLLVDKEDVPPAAAPTRQ